MAAEPADGDGAAVDSIGGRSRGGPATMDGRLMSTIKRLCSTCGKPFEISDDEQAFLAGLAHRLGSGFSLPTHCDPCRRARRRERYDVPVTDDGSVETIACRTCGEDFVFGGRDRCWWAAKGWTRPTRCRGCRSARSAERPQGAR
jgi:hypothetical protein